MHKSILIAGALLATVMITPAMAAGRGGNGGHAGGAQAGTGGAGRMGGAGTIAGAGTMGHGNSSMGLAVRQSALTSRQSGLSIGSSVRATARANSQGPEYASSMAISRVQNSPGQANNNSVLGSGGTTAGNDTTGTTSTDVSTSASTRAGPRLSTNTTSSTRTRSGTTTSVSDDSEDDMDDDNGGSNGGNGLTNRATARANSQGPTHASPNAISHVQNSPGQANANSVLGSGGMTSGTTTDTSGQPQTTNWHAGFAAAKYGKAKPARGH